MQICLIRDHVTLVMPVTPGSYRWAVGKRMETVNINQMGDVYFPGGRTRFSGSFTFLLPAQHYPWMETSGRADPQYYLDYLNAWAAEKQVVRLIITGTELNKLVYLSEVVQGEQDGTGDRYVTVSVREHCALEAAEVVVSGGGQGSGRSDQTFGGKSTSYTIVSGDTLSAICRRYYGKSSAEYYNALAKHNGIRNPHLIYPGTTIQIPPVSTLLGGLT